MAETRFLSASTSFAAVATAWAKGVGILDSTGNIVGRYPVIIGMPDNSADLGAFNIGIIKSSRTIKQALQDLETDVATRMFASNNLSDLPNKAQARTNLQLGSAATWPVGTDGATIPLLNTTNNWTGKQTFSASVQTFNYLEITNAVGQNATTILYANNSTRWVYGRSGSAETGGNAGSDFFINRYSDSGAYLDTPFLINRNTGSLSLYVPLGIASGGTGTNNIGTFKNTLGIQNVDNTRDVDKPISTAVNNALSGKVDKSNAALSGQLFINNTGPTIYLQDTDNRSSMIRCDGNAFFILRGNGNNSLTWDNGPNNVQPFALNLENGDVTIAGRFYTRGITNYVNGFSDIIGNGGTYQGLAVTNLYGSSNAISISCLDFRNELSVTNASLHSQNKTDGSTAFVFYGSAPGSRSADRRTALLTLDTTAATFNVPIQGRAFPRKSDGGDINFYWAGQSGQPTWVWGGNDGTNMNVYNPSNFNVAYANNAGSLSGIVGGDAGGYIRRNNDPNANGNWSRQLVLAGNQNLNSPWSAPLEIREVNKVANSNTDNSFAPAIVFHWLNVDAVGLRMTNDAGLAIRANSDTVGHRPFYALDHYAMEGGWFRVKSDAGVYWDNRNRGLAVADNGSAYGTVNVVGAGVNGWMGYSINNWITFMANGSGTNAGRGFYSAENGGWLLQWDSGNNAVFPANITAYSDERLKRNKRPIDNVAARREGMAAAAILYERDGQTRVGFGAQTLEQTNPEVVHTSDDLVGTKHVNYGDLVAVLAADAQQSAERINKLEAQLAELAARLDKEGK